MTKIVIEKTGSSCHSNDLDTVQNHLKDKLEGKKFLVVVDDVWSSNREGWESFLTPFECGSEGGHILVTTRLDSVASMVKTNHIQPLNLSLLHEEDCCFKIIFSTFENSFVMHDLMHDLATFYGGEFFSRTFELKNAAKHDAYPRHLSYDLGIRDSLSKFLEACDNLQHARTLLKINVGSSHDSSEEMDPCRLLAQLKRIRVLSFEFFPCDHNSLPDSIGDLIHLRYLDLSGTPIVTLPESMSNLYNLQTLKLAKCKRLKKLPSNMQNLVNMRHLDIEGTDLEEMPKKMSKLKDLQLLYFISFPSCNKIDWISISNTGTRFPSCQDVMACADTRNSDINRLNDSRHIARAIDFERSRLLLPRLPNCR
ncbi:hypothetical protein AHAS_Ahas02G0251500 [Arachis hypogaea]